ncbi:MAG: hypothetical protein OEZ34_07035 [Spirochaetia bacterium]|nr:hypothetical protein [Spirochaetia bacterium]
MEKKHIKDISKVGKAPDGVKVDITSHLESDLLAVQNIVESCATGACDCMKPEVKQKVTGMEFIRGQDGASIHIRGNISVEEIQETMDRSQKEINSSDCCSITDENSTKCC